ncbi:MAG TPA: retropepsin-like aspartic protease, partial [Anaerolineae bacterium]|nr:retropepsin-like aspartic protease [Anaerolineae bacterium]
MQLALKNDLPFATVMVNHQGETVTISNVLVDTGSATTIFSADMMALVHIVPSPEDILFTIRGVGGTEVVFTRTIERIQIAELSLSQFDVEIGGMDYGFDINGILGMDFLRQAG